ncbi:pyridoxamine 5'-phosphate oxidase family protein [Caulobacter sp. 17J65-9]|uniref:pyridoxamine 5'-phosphate oxidase family protein n=1 Tax=Caulobacter sp. 17J65-9 TaxID=2709382 RepID=UPI0013CC3C29|nr:pyridoxamine 5'-phosphate oxidase family protein [Caulobacter sp. 17J65-9]NEX92219.1 pyridoxamine 5'-phosphate oxidase family protein [Caulobacter sp. 17J65-9]
MEIDQRARILAILESANDLALATLREDGWPQATTVSFVNDGLNVYFGTNAVSQKARNIARDPRVSATLTLPYRTWDDIKGLSLAARAERVSDPLEMQDVAALVLKKFADVGKYVRDDPLDQLAVFRLRPAVFSILDYSRGFGWTELVRV